MRKVSGFIKIIRPVNCLMMGLAVIAGAIISSEGEISESNIFSLILGFLTALTLTGASMSINDYYDREIDAVNEPSRPIPSGLISPKESLVLSSTLAITGLSSATLIGTPCLLLAASSWLISVFYSRSGKRTGLPGNLMVSTCIAIPFIYGSICVKGSIDQNTLIFAILAFLTNTGREIVKGIADVEGDKLKGMKTLAILYGEKRAAQIALIFFVSAVMLSPLPIILKLTHSLFIPLVMIADAGFLISAANIVMYATRENAKKVKKVILIWMLIGLIAFIAGTVK